MARQELHAPANAEGIQQSKSINTDTELKEREGEVIEVDQDLMNAKAHKEQLARLKFMEEPITIYIEPSAEENAATSIPVWVNGRGAEILVEDQWVIFTYLPVETQIVVKRSVVEVLIRTKMTLIETKVDRNADIGQENKIVKKTRAAYAFTIRHDPNPLGPAWVTELRRRNF